MAYSYYNYTGDGSTTQFPVAFGYIRREHVLAAVAGSPATFTWVNSSTIQMDVAPANGATVRVYRVTPLSAPLVDFADGATLVAADLDTNARQSIYTQQELDDSLVEGLADVIPNGDKGDITTSVGGTVWTIDSGAVTEAKIASGAVTEAKIGSGAVIEAKIANGAVTETKIANGAVTVAKLASGFAPTVSSINNGPLAGLRNRIINGGMAVDQRNSGASVSSGTGVLTYALDRWIVAANTTAVTAQRGGVPGAYYLAVNGAAGNTAVSIRQRIEAANVADLSSKVVTLSFNCNSSSLTSIAINVSCASALDNFSTITNTQSFTRTISSTEATYSATLTLPSQASNGVEVLFSLTSFTSGTFGLTNVQIEPGSAATPFERRPLGLELELCYRYFQLLTYYGGAYAGANACFFTPEGFSKLRADPAISSTINSFHFFNNTTWVSVSTDTGASFSVYTPPIGPRAIQVNGLIGNGTTIPTPTSAAILGTLSAEL
jgi:hypothetical protein